MTDAWQIYVVICWLITGIIAFIIILAQQGRGEHPRDCGDVMGSLFFAILFAPLICPLFICLAACKECESTKTNSPTSNEETPLSDV